MAETTTSLPVGTPVRYWTFTREGPGRISRTRSTVQPLGGEGGTLVVWVEGQGSCIAMTHIEQIEEAEYNAILERRSALIKQHDWDILLFGGFFCTHCTSDDADEVTPWPCPPLLNPGVTAEEASEIIRADQAAIDGEVTAR